MNAIDDIDEANLDFLRVGEEREHDEDQFDFDYGDDRGDELDQANADDAADADERERKDDDDFYTTFTN